MPRILKNTASPIAWSALSFVICVVGSFIGASLRGSPPSAAGLRIEPAQLSLSDGCLEHSPVTLHLMLRNDFKTSFEVREVHLSCGCMALTSGENHPVAAGTVVGAGKASPLTITIDPENRSGPQTYLLQILGRVNGREVETQGEIHLSVRPGWRALSREVVFQPKTVHEELTAEVKVFDGYPGDGILFDQLETSSSTRITAEIVPSAPQTSHKHPTDFLRERFAIRLTYRPADPYESASDFVTVRPVDHNLGEKRILVRYLGVLPPVQLSPAELIIRRSDLADRAIERSIICRVRDSRMKPRVVRQPGDVQVEVSRVGPDTWQLRTIIAPAIKKVAEEPLGLSVEVGDQKWEVPIRITQL